MAGPMRCRSPTTIEELESTVRIESDGVVAEEMVREFPDMPGMKRVYRDKKASFHRSAARNIERFSSR